MTDASRSTPTGARLSRRRVIAGALAALVAALLAACAGPEIRTPVPSQHQPSAGASSPSATTPATTSPSASTQATPSASPAGSGEPATLSPPARPGLRTEIAGLIVAGFRGTRLADAPWLATALADGLGGVILFDRDQPTGGPRNVVSPAQVARLSADLRAAGGHRPVIVSVDQEGGLVTRLSPAYGFPAVASEATIGAGSRAAARRWAATIAGTLADAGIALNLAPVVDLDVDPSSPVIGALGRSFSADPDVVVAMAGIEIRAHRAAGVRTTLKHFPGIGSATANTDTGVVDVTATWTRVELAPFRRLIATGLADLIMAGHVLNRRLDPTRPASLSRAVVTDLLRGELGWDGLVITDDLQATAIAASYGTEQAAVLALEAGCDLLLIANQQVYDQRIVNRVVDEVAGAVDSGRLDAGRIHEAWGRVQRSFGSPVA